MKKEELIVIAVIAIAVIAMIYTQKQHSNVSTQAGAAPHVVVGNGGAPIGTVDVSPIAASGGSAA